MATKSIESEQRTSPDSNSLCGEEAVLISGKLCQTFSGIFKHFADFVFIHENRVSFTNEDFVIGKLIRILDSRFIK